MNLKLKLLLCCLLAIAFTPGIPVRTAQKDKEAEQKAELEKKTLALLNDVAAGAWGLKLPENRLFIMSGTADLLWSFDEKRARTLYWDALNSVNLIAAPSRSGTQPLSESDRNEEIRIHLVIYELRQKLLRQVARRDAQLAMDMLRATRQVPPRQWPPEYSFPSDLQLEQEIAAEIAVRDPALALKLARQSLAKGVTLELFNLLRQLNDKDPEKGSQFANDVIEKLKTINLANDFLACIVAVDLLQASRTPDAQPRARLTNRVGSLGGFKILKLSDEQKRELVDILANAALTTSANGRMLKQVGQVMPEVEQFAPERRDAIDRKLSSFRRTLSEGERNQNNYNSLIRGGTPEELVRAATSADEGNRLMLLRQAALLALAHGTTDSFRDVVNKDIANESQRATVLDILDTHEITVAAGRKQIDQLTRILPKIRRKEERARAMAELAIMLKEKGQTEEASAMLDEAATLIKMDLKDEKQTNALLTLMCAYAAVDPPKAFALAERSVDHANSQISLLLLLDKVVKTGAVKKNEILLEQPQLMSLDLLLFRYGKGVAALARADFNRTRALAERFERNELKLMAQLLVLKGLLQPQPSTDAIVGSRVM